MRHSSPSCLSPLWPGAARCLNAAWLLSRLATNALFGHTAFADLRVNWSVGRQAWMTMLLGMSGRQRAGELKEFEVASLAPGLKEFDS